MRKVTETIARAFLNGESRKLSNSETDGDTFWLHGNAIARRTIDGELLVTLSGWPTPTTRDRLNGIFRTFGLDFSVYQRDWTTYLSGPLGDIEMDCDEWYKITNAE